MSSDLVPTNQQGEALMAMADVYPVTDASKLLFLDNLVTVAGTGVLGVGRIGDRNR